MWDVNDGRCFNISAHNLFNEEDEITKMELLTTSECRYLACISLFFLKNIFIIFNQADQAIFTLLIFGNYELLKLSAFLKQIYVLFKWKEKLKNF